MKDEIKIHEINSYVPYRLEASVKGKDITVRDLFLEYDKWNAQSSEGQSYPIEQLRPKLRPMSELEFPMKHNGIEITPLIELLQFGGMHYSSISVVKNRVYGKWDDNLAYGKDEMWYLESHNGFYKKSDGMVSFVSNQLDLFQKLFEWHFDVYGLIARGLADKKL